VGNSFPGTVRVASRRLGIYKPLRFLYHALFFSTAKRVVTVKSIACTFRTPTPTVAEYVQHLTGEKDMLTHFLDHLRPNDVVWDVGAAFGMYAVLGAKKLLPDGKVFAFEPEPHMRRLLIRNGRSNDLHNLTVLPFALGATDKQATIFQSDTPNVGTTALVQRTDYKLKQRGTVVELRSGASLIRQTSVQPPTILKIDVEGAEHDVLRGLGNALNRSTLQLLYCEVHPHLLPLFGSSAEALERSVSDAGFRVALRRPRGSEYHLICMR
jgi:FkbM family methyltransferase